MKLHTVFNITAYVKIENMCKGPRSNKWRASVVVSGKVITRTWMPTYRESMRSVRDWR